MCTNAKVIEKTGVSGSSGVWVYVSNYSLRPVMHTGLCPSILILYGKSKVIYTPTKIKLTWPSTTNHENAFCSILVLLREIWGLNLCSGNEYVNQHLSTSRYM